MENNETMTNDQIEKVMDELDKNVAESDKLSFIANLPSNNGEEENANKEDGYYTKAAIAIDPETGEHKVLGNFDENSEKDVKSFEEAIDDSDINDFTFEEDTSPITEEEAISTLNDLKSDPNSMIGDITKDLDLSPEDTMTILELANKQMNHEKFNAYKEFPQSIRDMINKYLGPQIAGNNSNEAKRIKNTVSEALLDEFITSISIDRTKNTFNQEIENMFSKTSAEVGDSIIGYTSERNAKFREYADQLEDEEKKEKISTILDIIDEAYNLNSLKEFCKKCKIKHIELENIDAKKSRYIDDIMTKYDNNKNYNIYNLYNAEAILRRKLNQSDDDQYNNKDVRAFLVAFSMYCRNYNPANVNEHTFMYYTIYNIVISDVNIGENKNVSDIFLDNIKDCINNLRERNNFFM